MNWTDTNNELPTRRTTSHLHLSLLTDNCETARTTSATFVLSKLQYCNPETLKTGKMVFAAAVSKIENDDSKMMLIYCAGMIVDGEDCLMGKPKANSRWVYMFDSKNLGMVPIRDIFDFAPNLRYIIGFWKNVKESSHDHIKAIREAIGVFEERWNKAFSKTDFNIACAEFLEEYKLRDGKHDDYVERKIPESVARRLKQIKPVNNVCDSQFENNMQKGAEKSVKNSMDTSQAHHSSEGENHPQNMDVSQANHSSEGKTRPSNQALPRETCETRGNLQVPVVNAKKPIDVKPRNKNADKEPDIELPERISPLIEDENEGISEDEFAEICENLQSQLAELRAKKTTNIKRHHKNANKQRNPCNKNIDKVPDKKQKRFPSFTKGKNLRARTSAHGKPSAVKAIKTKAKADGKPSRPKGQ